MNNKILKSLRHTMLSTVAAAIVSIGFTACSDEMTLTKNSSAPADGYKVCIPASIGGGETRAIAYNSETGGYDATFETTDAIIAYYRTDNFDLNSREPLKPDVNGKSANLVGKLEFYSYNPDTQTETLVTPAVGDELHLFYKSTSFEYSRDFSNEWDVETDYAVATVTITAINDGTITTTPATFRNYQSIFDVNFTGIAPGVKIKKMRIASNQDKLVSEYLNFSPYQQDRFGSVTYTYKNEGTDQHKLTFLLRFATNPNSQSSEPGDVITFTAVASDGHIYSGTKSVSANLENSKYYQADVAMTDKGLAFELINATTGQPVELNSGSMMYSPTSMMCSLNSKNAAYTASNIGYDIHMEWEGGENALTLKDLFIQNAQTPFIFAVSNADDTKAHHLILDGENVVNNSVSYPVPLSVKSGCALDISSVSTGTSTGKLNLCNSGLEVIGLEANATLTIESGEVTVDGKVYTGENSSIVITNSGKIRIKIVDAFTQVKAGSGFILNTANEGDYTVYTVTAAPAYEGPKALNTVTTEDIGKIIGSDGKVHVPHWGLPEGVSPVGVITHISPQGHGLALAKPTVTREGNPSRYDYWYSWDNSGSGNGGKTAMEIFENWKTNNGVTFGTWRLATKEEWQKMVISCRIEGDATAAADDMVAEGLAAILKDNGIMTNNYYPYWIKQNDDSILAGEINHYEDKFKISIYDTEATIGRCILPVLEF